LGGRPTYQQQSAHDEVSGPDPGLYVRTDRGVHVNASLARLVEAGGGVAAG
jgi:hypothetical protein